MVLKPQVCAYVLLAPTVYSFIWLSIYGGLGHSPLLSLNRPELWRVDWSSRAFMA